MKGRELADKFNKERLLSSTVEFIDPIKHNINKTFLATKKRIEIKKGNVKKSVEVNRVILVSVKFNKSIDYKEALKFPLSPTPLSISNADGSMRKTNKSVLTSIILNFTNTNKPPVESNSNSVYIVDMISAIRTLREIPETFKDLANKLVRILPVGYAEIHIVADSYRNISLKTP